ncbi:hypothetical protein JCM10207_005554 [Rhodosporidiobolus poonsookiae]
MSTPFDKKTMRVAVCQLEPVWLDTNACIDKAIGAIKEAAAKGAELECWIPGFAHGIMVGAPDPAWVLKYQKASMSLNSPEFDRLRQGVREAGVWVVMGFSERAGSSLYMAQSFISPSGEVALHRRKFRPTHAERYLWGEANGDSLECTVETEKGVVIGGLECWEHLQPLLRFYEYSKGVQVHVASWPHLAPYGPGVPYQSSGTASANATSFMALEGGCFTLCCSQITSKEGSAIMNVKTLDNSTQCAVPLEGGGFSGIYAPDGRRLTPEVDHKEEIILYADLDFDEILQAKQMADCVGHYSRPEILSLNVNTERKTIVNHADGRHKKTLTELVKPLSL